MEIIFSQENTCVAGILVPKNPVWQVNSNFQSRKYLCGRYFGGQKPCVAGILLFAIPVWQVFWGSKTLCGRYFLGTVLTINVLVIKYLRGRYFAYQFTCVAGIFSVELEQENSSFSEKIPVWQVNSLSKTLCSRYFLGNSNFSNEISDNASKNDFKPFIDQCFVHNSFALTLARFWEKLGQLPIGGWNEYYIYPLGYIIPTPLLGFDTTELFNPKNEFVL